jgi:hypothetical protein
MSPHPACPGDEKAGAARSRRLSRRTLPIPPTITPSSTECYSKIGACSPRVVCVSLPHEEGSCVFGGSRWRDLLAAAMGISARRLRISLCMKTTDRANSVPEGRNSAVSGNIRPSEICRGCGHARHCQSIYSRLGYTKGPSVAWSALLAFGIPLVVFIVTLAVAGALLGGFTGQPALPMFLAFLIALVLTAAVVLAICKITQRPVDRGDSSKL